MDWGWLATLLFCVLALLISLEVHRRAHAMLEQAQRYFEEADGAWQAAMDVYARIDEEDEMRWHEYDGLPPLDGDEWKEGYE